MYQCQAKSYTGFMRSTIHRTIDYYIVALLCVAVAQLISAGNHVVSPEYRLPFRFRLRIRLNFGNTQTPVGLISEMSIQLNTETGWIISHHIEVETEDGQKFQLNPNLFGINSPFKLKKPKFVSETSKLVKSLAEEILDKWNTVSRTDMNKNVCKGNDLAIQIAKDFYGKFKEFEFGKFNGGNNEKFGVVKEVKDCSFVFPQNCRFYNGDILEMVPDGKFDLIVLDPPWWNKFIRRKRKYSDSGYPLLDTSMITKIPIESISNQDALIVVWCTNSPSIQNKLISEIFPSWNVYYVATWYWLKVTTSGIPICPFDSDNKKQPYEAIIIGCRKKMDNINTKIIVSVPSSIHSHKPPLFEVLNSEFNNIVNSCEIFSRYLYPNVTSYGNEVIKLQHSSLFVSP